MDLKGKTVSFLGDSITEGRGVEDPANRYDNVVAKELGLAKVNNYGISGTRIAHQVHPSEKARHDMNFCGRCYDMDPRSDVIVVYGGINDYWHGDAPIGKVGDRTQDTFCGAVDYLIRTIRELYPSAVLVMMTPARCCDALPFADKRCLFGQEMTPLKDYVCCYKRIASLYKVPVVDLYDGLGIDPNDERDHLRYTVDGLHFNDLGHRRIAACLIERLKAI